MSYSILPVTKSNRDLSFVSVCPLQDSIAFLAVCELFILLVTIVAAFIGAYLGLLWIWSGNLLTPIITTPYMTLLRWCTS
jgi:hypothetical protein